jgi:hypothetical protein
VVLQKLLRMVNLFGVCAEKGRREGRPSVNSVWAHTTMSHAEAILFAALLPRFL